MNWPTPTLLDLDHAMTRDGQIYRVVGNLDSPTHFLGYNVYSPSDGGDRLYQGRRYRKNFTEDTQLPADVLETYHLIAIEDIAEHHDPVYAARSSHATFEATVWHELYEELVNVFGVDSVGIFGSAMFGLHLTPDGQVRKDVDFVIQGLANVACLRRHLPKIRDRLGFTPVTTARQLQQHARYEKLFRNSNNSIREIIARRWTGLQLSEHVVSTIRLRDPTVIFPLELTARHDESHDVVAHGRVTGSATSNLFPRTFRVITQYGSLHVYILWWKFSTPVRDGDVITLCGSLITTEHETILRLTNFTRHWLKIET